MSSHFIFTTLAGYQTPFYVGLAKELKRQGHDSCIISFHQESNALIEEAGIACHDAFKYFDENISNVDEEFNKIISELRIDSPTLVLSHEKITFKLDSYTPLKKKFISYSKLLNEIFRNISQKEYKNVFVIQETGGFTSLLSTFYVSQSFNFSHYFLEPSFFKGRLFFSKNSVLIPKVSTLSESVSEEVRSYLEKTVKDKSIVIPQKDTGHYNFPLLKVINSYNVKRFFQKLFSKYVLRQKEEFSHIGEYVARHLRMVFNKFYFNRFYKDKLPSEKFIYYPFHVPMDVALTVRSPRYVDQYSFIDSLARCAPAGYKVAIKEHPAMIGVVDRKQIQKLVRNNENLVFLHPKINNYDIMSKMDLLVTINSKAGAEGILLGKKVVAFGDAFYKKCPLIHEDHGEYNLTNVLKNALKNPSPEKISIEKYFQSVWDNSYKGELYQNSEENYYTMVNSILSIVD